MKSLLALTGALLLCTGVFAQTDKELKAFPAAKKGYQRFVIQLQPKSAEEDYQVEIFAGKTMRVDCNKHGLIGKFLQKDVQGWGYTYYEYQSDGQTRSTLMACPDKTLHEAFIAGSKLVRYNSKLPVVVYVPKGFEVRYKIWERSSREEKAVLQ
jgi:ecotin